MARILVVDDDEGICSVFAEFLADEGHEAEIAGNAEDALARLADIAPDLVLMDVRMPGLDGLEALERMRRADPGAQVVIMTAYGTSQTAIDAMRLGAYDCLIKPIELQQLKDVIDSALAAHLLSREFKQSELGDGDGYSMVDLIGSAPEMQKAYKMIGMLATNEVAALLVGEQGTGKHLVARTIHDYSERSDGPFEAVRCRNWPVENLEAEIFGKPGPDGGGCLKAAAGGTLFLDDVEVLPLNLQGRLLRFMHHRSGEDARLIAGTGAGWGVRELVREGEFNRELYERLRTLFIRLPPLRRRLEDLPELVDHLVRRCNIELGKQLRGVDEQLMEQLKTWSWPGNVAELDNVIRRAAVLARGEVITVADLDGELGDSSWGHEDDAGTALERAVRLYLRQRLREQEEGEAPTHFHEIVRQVEEVLVREALAETSGNQVLAAALLGLNRTTLRKKLGL